MLSVFSFTPNNQRNQLDSVAKSFYHNLQFAKMEAIKRNSKVGICGSSDLNHCDNNWNQGYIIYLKSNNQLLRKVQITSKDINILVNNQQNPIIYNGMGRCLTRCNVNVLSNKISQTVNIKIYDSGKLRITSLQ